MKKTRKLRLLAAAIAFALPAFAMAQGQIHPGRANDASNRIGSGGYNSGGIPDTSSYSRQIINTGNQIVTGNVTMGRSFRGNVGYSDPSAFRGPTAGLGMDNFVKNSSGVPQGYAPPPVPNTSTPFYGASSTAAPPPGYTLGPRGNAYVPPAATTGQRGLEDQRLGVIDLNQPLTPLPASTDLITRGRLSQESNGGIVTASPLYGIREWNPADQGDRMFLENMLNRSSVFDRIRMDPRDVHKMREELRRNSGEEIEQPKPIDAAINTGPNQFDPSPYPSLGTPANPQIKPAPVNDQVKPDVVAAGVTTDQSYRQYVVGARKHNTQYSELAKRLEQYYGDRKKTDADFAREFNEDVRAKAAAEAKAKAEAAKRGAGEVNPIKPAIPEKTTDDTTKPKIKKPTPTKINTLATGAKSEGLANLLKKAEDLMKEGKFASALDQYDAADAVSQNSPWVLMGRANAELGAGFFMRADAHLRQAYLTDKALLLAQMDLKVLMGEDRVKKVVADLKEIANKDQKQATPLFLLAYVYYNIGGEAEAQGYLELAEKRAGAPDPVFKLIREHWDLKEKEATPTPTPTPDGNK